MSLKVKTFIGHVSFGCRYSLKSSAENMDEQVNNFLKDNKKLVTNITISTNEDNSVICTVLYEEG